MKKLVLLLFALVAMGLSNVWAYDFSAVAPSGQTLYYNIVDGNAEVTYPNTSAYSMNEAWSGYATPTGVLNIPLTVTYNDTTYSVTSIENGAFAECIGLTSVTIPNSVTTIGNAFYGCSGLTSVTIPNSVTTIGVWAFALCSGLTSLTVATGNTHYDSRNGCNAIIETNTNTLIVGCRNTIIPNSVTSIGNWAFYGCSGLTSVTIPNSVTSIGGRAFSGCSGLTSVTIPNSVTTIGNAAFYNCSGLTSVTIPNSVTTIGVWAFCGCSGLTSVTIPNSVTIIDTAVFIGCSSLTSVTIPNSVTTIGNAAFRDCSGLTSVTIGNSVTSIGYGAFADCSGLTEINSKARTAPQLGSDVFAGINSNIPVNIPCGSMMSYMSRWSCFSNFVEGLGFSFEANSIDTTMGSIVVLNQPTCANPLAEVNAVANSGYQFYRWSNGATQNPYSFNLTKDTVLTAYFAVEVRDTVFIHDTIIEQLAYYTLTVQSSNATRGLVAGNGRFPEGTEVEIAAIPVEGNHFVQWNDQSTENPRRVTLTENATYVATFEQNATQGVVDVMLNNYSVSTREGIIVVKDAEGEQLRVFDVTGRLLHQGRIENAEWHVGVQTSGAYFVQVGGGVAQKVVVVK